MKRIAMVAVMMLLGLGAGARSIHYFTYSQASRTVAHLNRQSELMIYCGYDYEIETYVLVNEVWMERVNSAYYEIWLYGFDAYTGEEVYMPLDLQCVWLYSAGRMYNAAQYLRFRVSTQLPPITWRVPAYNPYTRVAHRSGYVRTYHYDVHRHGWMPPAYSHGAATPPPMHPYYMRRPHSEPPMPEGRWTPGVDRPRVVSGERRAESGVSERTRDKNPVTGTKATQTTRSTHSTTRSTSAPSSTTPTKATTTTRSTSTPAAAPAVSTPTKAPTTTRSTSVPTKAPAVSTPTSTPTKAPATTRSTSAPTKAPATTRSTSTPTKAPATTRSTSTPTKAPATTRSTSAPKVK